MTVQETIYAAIAKLNAENGSDIPQTPDTELFGPTSPVDSLGLITILMDVETETGVALTDDPAFEEVPWRTVASLTDYVAKRL